MTKNAVVLLSGGIDSVTTLYQAKNTYQQVEAMSFLFGQRHTIEIEFATFHCQQLNIKHHIIDLTKIGQAIFSSSSLVNKEHTLEIAETVGQNVIPSSYVPCRNLLFLSFAAALVESKKGGDIFIGVNVLDYSNYPDCRAEFISAVQNAINLGSKTFNETNQLITIKTPIINKTKSEIIQLGVSLSVDYSKTISCYNPNSLGQSCGQCLSCDIRKKGFASANIPDPTRYF